MLLPPPLQPTTNIVFSSKHDYKQTDYLVTVHLLPQRCQ